MDEELPADEKPVYGEDDLLQFCENNGSSNVKIRGGQFIIENAWGEKAVELGITVTDKDAIDALNHLVLPERYSAIWHIDTSDLEVIFTAFKISSEFPEFSNRRFEFSFNQKTYVCEFAPSSERLLAVAGSLRTRESSQTQWRNLITYQQFMNRRNKGQDVDSFNPISFWIRGVDLRDEDNTLLLINHLNFYMSYYDGITPRVVVHSQVGAGQQHQRAIRFPHGQFPPEVKAGKFDEILWHFWDASVNSGDPFRRFIYNYQIIEYAAEYYVDEDVKRSIKRLLAQPDFNSNIDITTSRLIDMLAPKRSSEIQKRAALLTACVDASRVWAEIVNNRTYFENKTSFEGNYVVKALITKDTQFSSWENDWGTSFEAAIRHVRNGLSHGREASTSGVISPTIHNQSLIQPWLGPLMIAARQVMIFESVI